MENLFAAKTGLGAHELNCQEMTLTLDDLSTLERLIANVDLPHCDAVSFTVTSFRTRRRRNMRPGRGILRMGPGPDRRR